jgi:hypothetical protein
MFGAAAASLVILSERLVKDDDADETSEDQTQQRKTSLRIQLSNSLPFTLSAMMSSFPIAHTTSCEATTALQQQLKKAQISKRNTIRKMRDTSTLERLESKYKVYWDKVLGRGAYGAVYLATNRRTGEQVAIKKISKKAMDTVDFQREMNALLHLQRAGGHPNICSLHEHFDEGGFYYVVLDLIGGGEMFDHLVSNGAFSEHDASRLVREVASALAFIHGLDTVHADLKPENLMLSTNNPLDAVIKLVDFGCAQVIDPDSPFSEGEDAVRTDAGTTPAYCPPEVLEKVSKKAIQIKPSMDMWALGVILYM